MPAKPSARRRWRVGAGRAAKRQVRWIRFWGLVSLRDERAVIGGGEFAEPCLHFVARFVAGELGQP